MAYPTIDPNRRELLRLLEELSVACPDYRFGQLVLNLAVLARDDGDKHAWDLADAEFVEAARKHLADWNATHEPTRDSSTIDPVLAPS